MYSKDETFFSRFEESRWVAAALWQGGEKKNPHHVSFPDFLVLA